MGLPLKYTTTWNRKRMKRGNLALGLGNQNFNTIGGYSNMPPPSEGKYVVYKRTGANNTPICWSASNTSELYSIAVEEGYTGNDTLSNILNWIADQNDLMVLTKMSTITNEVEPFATYQAQGNNPSKNSKWYSLEDPDGFESTEHGLSEWICMESKTIDYAAPYGGTKIYEIDTNNNVSLKGNVGSNPGRGGISAVAGYRYVANKPISLVATANQNAIAPLSYQGTQWGYYFNRYSPPILYVYAFDDDTIVDIKANNENIASFTVDEQQVYSYTISGDYINDFINIQTSKPTVCTARGTSGDKGVIPLAGEYNYRRSNGYERTVNNTAPSNALTNVVYDNTGLNSWGIDIADGSGGDSECTLPLEMLSSNYAYGDYLRSFYLVSPNSGNEISISSWNGSSWTVRNEYTLNGTLTSPATAQSGSQAGGDRFNDDQMWKFEGSEPFYIVINDDGRDEEVLFGWNDASVKCLFT